MAAIGVVDGLGPVHSRAAGVEATVPGVPEAGNVRPSRNPWLTRLRSAPTEVSSPWPG